MIPYENHLASLRPDAVARKVLLVSTAVTLALYMIPYGRYLARPLLLLSTLAHEMGHGLTALLLGGSFRRLAIWPSGAGLADLDLAGFGRIRQGLTLAGGLVGPSVAAALCFALGKTGQGARWCLLGLGLLLLAAEILGDPQSFRFLLRRRDRRRLPVRRRPLLAAGRAMGGRLPGRPARPARPSRADYLFTKTAANPSGIYPSDVLQMQYALSRPTGSGESSAARSRGWPSSTESGPSGGGKRRQGRGADDRQPASALQDWRCKGGAYPPARKSHQGDLSHADDNDFND